MNFYYCVPSLLSGLTQADLETIDHSGNGTSNGVDSDNENQMIEFKEEVKEEEVAEVTTPQHVLTTFELEGLCNLLGKLEELPPHKKCVPAGIRDATALLDDMRVGVALCSSSHSDLTLATLYSNTYYKVCFYCLYGAVPW